MRLRRPALAVFCALLLAAGGRGVAAEMPSEPATALAERYARAETAPAETTIFVFNRILLTTKGFERKGATYEAEYSAKVSPFKSLSENGTLTIDVTDEQLRQLERGTAVDFKGRAVSKGGSHHAVTGTAIPGSKTSGELKVHIEASIVTLKFSTSYRFTSALPAAAPDGAVASDPTAPLPSPTTPAEDSPAR